MIIAFAASVPVPAAQFDFIVDLLNGARDVTTTAANALTSAAGEIISPRRN